jgi:MFS family permease
MPSRTLRPKYQILALIWLMMLVAYMDRVNISVAGKVIMADLHFNKAAFGFVLSAFTLGYALLQAPGGWLADRFGARKPLIAAILLWSLFTGLTGLAVSFATLVLVRILFGVGEGIENGAQFKLIGDHFHPRERSRANALFLTALPLGPLVASPLAVWLLAREGWRMMFWSFAVLGLAVAVLLWLWLPHEAVAGPAVRQSLGPTLQKPGTKPAMLAYLLFNIAFWGFVGWIPTYLQEQRDLSLPQLGLLGAMPYGFGFLGLLAVGQLGTGRLAGHRKRLVGACYGAAGVFTVLACYAPSGAVCIALLSVAAFFLFGAVGPFWALALGLCPAENRGAFSGLVNFGGQIGGVIGQVAVGFLADRMKDFSGAFWFMGAALMAAGVVIWGRKDRRVADG